MSLAEQRLGKVTALVYAQFLGKIEPKILRCKDNDGDETGEDDGQLVKSMLFIHRTYILARSDFTIEIKLSCLELSKSFSKEIKLEGSIVTPPKESKLKARKRSLHDSDSDTSCRNGSLNPNGKSLHGSDESEEDDDEDEWADADADMDLEAINKRNLTQLLKQHLQLLEEDSFKFLTGESNRGMGEWSVDYKELGKRMRGIELEKIVEERFESTGTRLLRIIKDKGKMDEKQVDCLFSCFWSLLADYDRSRT